MRVLLISPLDPQIPDNSQLKLLMGGENTYTQTLLTKPPTGVVYVHYHQAIKTGEIEWGRWYWVLVWLIKLGILPLGPRVIDIKIKGRFDLIHTHVHPVRVDRSVPVMVSDSSANWLTLKYYFGWPEWRIDWTTKIQDFVFSRLGVVNAPDIVWSEFAKKLHRGRGEVIPPGSVKKKCKSVKHKGVNIIFIGTWFERKGGREVVAAYRRLCKSVKYKSVNLIVVGEVPKDVDLTGIEHYSWLSKTELDKKVFARGDILVHVPPVVEGYGLVVQEAMAWGIPAIVTNIGALPELVVRNKTGIVTHNLNSDLERLVRDKKMRYKMGQAARRRFLSKFAVAVMNKKLRAVYEKHISRYERLMIK